MIGDSNTECTHKVYVDCIPETGIEVVAIVGGHWQYPKESSTFQIELERLLNIHSMENESNTPDFILAQYLKDCLDCFNAATKRRDEWYSIKSEPGWDGKRTETKL